MRLWCSSVTCTSEPTEQSAETSAFTIGLEPPKKVATERRSSSGLNALLTAQVWTSTGKGWKFTSTPSAPAASIRNPSAPLWLRLETVMLEGGPPALLTTGASTALPRAELTTPLNVNG